MAVSLFLRGLNEEIQYHSKMLRSRTIHETYCLAKLQEAYCWVIRRMQGNLAANSCTVPLGSRNMLARPTFGDTQGQLATSADSKGLLPMATSTIASKKKGAEIVKTTKTLSHTKYEDQRRRDLCCWCDNKFSPGHQCLKR